MTKDEVVNLRVPADVKAALKHAAEADDRSVSSMALKIIREWLVTHRMLREPVKGDGRKTRRPTRG